MVNASRYPRFHFAPQSGWMNDPNGLVHIAGKWHLFYQKSDIAPDYRVIGWGHAVSDDLLVWHDLGMAIPPNSRGYAYSGSVADVDGDGTTLAALFTRHDPKSLIQTQELALSADGAASWHSAGVEPVLDERLARFRDPFIVRHADATWRMLLVKPIDWHAWQDGRSRIVQYSSNDLRKWRSIGRVGPEGGRGELYEVPLLLRMPIAEEPGEWRWVLVTSLIDRANDGATCRAICWIGDLRDDGFEIQSGPIPLDYGPDFYAATIFSGLPPGEIVMVGWLSSWAYARRTPDDAPRGGTQSIPRRLSLHRDAAGAMALRHTPAVDPASPAASRAPVAWDLADGVPLEASMRSTSFRASFEVDFGQSTLVEIALRVGASCKTIVTLDRRDGTIALDRSQSGATDFDPGFAGTWRGPMVLADGRIDLTILVDSCSVEIFAANGSVALSAQIFPHEDADRICVAAHGGGGARVSGDLVAIGPA